MKTRALIIASLFLALPLAGCIENMGDLKQRLQGNSVEKEPTDGLDDAANDLTNSTKRNATGPPLKAPVARVTVFGPGGALVYRASYVAENKTDEVVIMSGGESSFVAADSEALNGGADLVKFDWTIAGKAYSGRKVSVNFSEPGLVMVTLRVTDSKGAWDEQMVHFGILPEPFTETQEFTGGPIAGASALPLPTGSAEHAFTVVAEKDGKPLKVQAFSVEAAGGSGNDVILTVVDPEGTETSADAASTGGSETIAFSTAAPGEWKIIVSSFAGASVEYLVTVSVTYVEVVEGLGDGHAHQH